MKKHIIILIICTLSITACQYRDMKNLSKCEFKFGKVEELKLAGVDIENVKSLSDLNFINSGKITAAALRGDLRLTFVINIDIKNPNKHKAAVNKLEWIAFIDDSEIFNGIIDERLEISPGEIASTKIKANVNLQEVFSGKTGASLINVALGLVGGKNEATRLGIKVKPSIKIGNTFLNYPGYITIKKEFSVE